MKTQIQNVDLAAYDDGTWTLRETGQCIDIDDDDGRALSFSTDAEARQYAHNAGWNIVHYDT